MPDILRHQERGRVLVADEDPSERRQLRGLLAREGHSVRIASDAAEAVRLLRDEPFDVVLVDLDLPSASAAGILDAAQGHAGARVILLAGPDRVGAAVEGLRRGAHGYLTTPVRADEAVLAVSRALDQSRSDSERRRAEEALRLERQRSRALARELEGVIERAVLLARGGWIDGGHLPPEIARMLHAESRWPDAPNDAGGAPEDSVREPSPEALSLQDAERRHILAVLRTCGGNKKKAAALLGINRSSLYDKLRRLGVDGGAEGGPRRAR